MMVDENEFQSLAAAFGLSTRNDITRSCYLRSNYHHCVIIYPILSDINDNASF